MTGRRVLLVNDDGVGAAGLDLLTAAVADISDDVWVVAPASERSGASQSISLSTPLRARRLGERLFAVDGTPVDCVVLALCELLDRPPDLVLSGVNRGPNLADDIAYSGTCGAAQEAARRGISAVALSLAVLPGGVEEWGYTQAALPEVLRRITESDIGGFLNVNFPSLPAAGLAEFRTTRVGSYPVDRFSVTAGEDPRGVPYWWLKLGYPTGPGTTGTDIACVGAGKVSVTPLRADLTDEQRVLDVERAFA